MADAEVDPSALREYSVAVDDASGAVSRSRLPDGFHDLAACMPGSSTAYASNTSVPVLRGALDDLADYYSDLSSAVRNAAGEFEGTDDDIAAKLRGVLEAK